MPGVCRRFTAGAGCLLQHVTGAAPCQLWSWLACCTQSSCRARPCSPPPLLLCVVGLLCLKVAKSGGLSSIASSVTIHNELLRSEPELLEVAAGTW